MRNLALTISLAAVPLSIFAGASCASKNFNGNDGGDGGDGGTTFGDSNIPDGLQACATGEYQAHQDPAAMLVLLQASGSMNDNNKWVFASQALVQTLDKPVFDDMTIGFMSAPSSTVNAPACLGIPIQVACGVPAFPQVDLKLAGTSKSSDSSGVRHDIKSWLTSHTPDNSAGEGNPLYAAIQSGIGTLQGWPGPGKRILFVVTDGAISCTSLSQPSRAAYLDGNNCPDWENPNNIISLVNQANNNQATPIDSFIIGVPGSDSTGSDPNYPPYHMRAALSDIAYAGSPANAPVGCTHTNPFAQTDPDPAVACHFDMTQNNFSTQAIADAIAVVRGKVLGCIFNLPSPEAGTVNPDQVNVSYTVGGGSPNDLFKRATPSEDCSQTGCWDYTTDGKVELFGKACTDVEAATDANVQITVGCATIVK